MGHDYIISFKLLSFGLIFSFQFIESYGGSSGGLKFGYKGKTYSFSTETCDGGVFFKKPIPLDFICPNGYFLKRSDGCSANGEDIVGAERYVCTDFKKRKPRVQAFIPVTNPDSPTDHTIALYDDENFLTGFRRYTMQSVANKDYIPKDNGSSHIFVANPHKIHDMSVGKLCYKGVPQAKGSAYKVQVQSDFSDGEGYGFFSKGCKKSSVKIEPSSGIRFGFKDGTPDLKRFARAIEAKIDPLEDYDGDLEAQLRVKKDDQEDKVFIDLDRDDKNSGGKSKIDGGGDNPDAGGSKQDGSTSSSNTETGKTNGNEDSNFVEKPINDGGSNGKADNAPVVLPFGAEDESKENGDSNWPDDDDSNTDDKPNADETKAKHDEKSSDEGTDDKPDEDAKNNSDKDAEETTDKDAEEKPNKDAEEKPNKDAEEKLDKDAEENPDKDAEESPDKDAKDKADKDAEDKPDNDGEDKPDQDAEDKADKDGEDKPDNDGEDKPDKDAKDKLDKEPEEKPDDEPNHESSDGQTETDNDSNDPLLPIDDNTDDEDTNSNWPSGDENGDDRKSNKIDPDDNDNNGKDDDKSEMSTEEPDDDGVPLDYSELKDDVIIDPDKTVVSPYFIELLTISQMRVVELFGEVEETSRRKRRSLVGNSATFLETSVESRETKWFKILSASVEVTKSFLPETSFPTEIFTDVLQVFGYMFRSVGDDRNIVPDDTTFANMIDALEKCKSSPEFKKPIYTFSNDTCPPEMEGITVSGWVWNDTVEDYSLDVPLEFHNVKSLNERYILPPSNYRFNDLYHAYVELMFMAFDIAYVSCFDNFKEDLNAHSRMGFYLSENVFVEENIYKHWTEVEKLNIQIYLSMMIHWNRRAFPKLTWEQDVIRTAIRMRTVPSAWIRPDKAALHDIPGNSPTLKQDLGSTDSLHKCCKGGCDDCPPGIKCPTCKRRPKFARKNLQQKENRESPFNELPKPENMRRRKLSRMSLLGRNNPNRLSKIGSRSGGHPASKMEWKRKRRNVNNFALKTREIWNGLAYCMSMEQIENSQGQIKQLGLQPPLETFKSASLC